MTFHTLSRTPSTAFGELVGGMRLRAANRLALGLRSRSVHMGLRRDMRRGLDLPASAAQLSLHQLTPELRDAILPADHAHLPPAERGEIALRRHFAELMPEHGVAVVDIASGEPCYVLWIVGARDNRLIRRLEGIPPLKPHQALAEGAYVPPPLRGRGLMTPASLLALTRAVDFGATEVVSFIGETNTASLKGAIRAGFVPHRRHIRHHFLFGLVHLDRFEDLPAAQPNPGGNGPSITESPG